MDNILRENFSSAVKVNIESLQQIIDNVLNSDMTNGQIRRVCSKISVVKAFSAFIGVSEYADVFRGIQKVCEDLYNRDMNHKKRVLSIVRKYINSIKDLEVDGKIYAHLPELEYFIAFPDSFIFFDIDPLDMIINEDNIKIPRVDCIQNFIFLNNLENSIKKEEFSIIKESAKLVRDSFYLSYFDDLKDIKSKLGEKYTDIIFNIPDVSLNLFKDNTTFLEDTIEFFIKGFGCEDRKIHITIDREDELSYFIEFICDSSNEMVLKNCQDNDPKMRILYDDWKEIYKMIKIRSGNESLKKLFHLFLSIKTRMRDISFQFDNNSARLKLIFPDNFFLSEGVIDE